MRRRLSSRNLAALGIVKEDKYIEPALAQVCTVSYRIVWRRMYVWQDVIGNLYFWLGVGAVA